MQNFTELYEVERRYEELAHRMSTPDAAANAAAEALPREAQFEALKAKVDDLQGILANPLNEIPA